MRPILIAAAVITGSVCGQNNCDRAYLESFVDQYLDAVVAHDSSHLAVAKDIKYAENRQRPVVVDQERGLVRRGKTRCIEAIIEANVEQVPCGMGSGWSNRENQMSSRAR